MIDLMMTRSNKRYWIKPSTVITILSEINSVYSLHLDNYARSFLGNWRFCSDLLWYKARNFLLQIIVFLWIQWRKLFRSQTPWQTEGKSASRHNNVQCSSNIQTPYVCWISKIMSKRVFRLISEEKMMFSWYERFKYQKCFGMK